MSATYSFYKVVSDLIDYCNSNAVISQVYYEQEFQMEGSTEASYPAVIIEREGSVIDGGENIFSLRIIAVDLPKEDQSDKLIIHSKLHQIIDQLEARFNLGETAQYTLVNDISPEPIAYEKNDRVEGWGATFDFSVRRDTDGCEYPVNE